MQLQSMTSAVMDYTIQAISNCVQMNASYSMRRSFVHMEINGHQLLHENNTVNQLL